MSNTIRGQQITDAQIAESDKLFAQLLKALEGGIEALRVYDKARTETVNAMEEAVAYLKRFLMGQS